MLDEPLHFGTFERDIVNGLCVQCTTWASRDSVRTFNLKLIAVEEFDAERLKRFAIQQFVKRAVEIFGRHRESPIHSQLLSLAHHFPRKTWVRISQFQYPVRWFIGQVTEPGAVSVPI